MGAKLVAGRVIGEVVVVVIPTYWYYVAVAVAQSQYGLRLHQMNRARRDQIHRSPSWQGPLSAEEMTHGWALPDASGRVALERLATGFVRT